MHLNVATYQFQLLELHESLLHARLVHLNLLVFLTKGKITVTITLQVAAGDVLEGPSFILHMSASKAPGSLREEDTNPESFFQICHLPVILGQHGGNLGSL